MDASRFNCADWHYKSQKILSLSLSLCSTPKFLLSSSRHFIPSLCPKILKTHFKSLNLSTSLSFYIPNSERFYLKDTRFVCLHTHTCIVHLFMYLIYIPRILCVEIRPIFLRVGCLNWGSSSFRFQFLCLFNFYFAFWLIFRSNLWFMCSLSTFQSSRVLKILIPNFISFFMKLDRLFIL